MAAGSCFTLPLCYYSYLPPSSCLLRGLTCWGEAGRELHCQAKSSHKVLHCLLQRMCLMRVVKILVWSDYTQGTMSILTAHIWMLKSVRFSSGSLVWNWKSPQSLLPSNLVCLKPGSSLIAETKDGSTGKQTASIGFPVQEKVPGRGESDKYVQVGKNLS